MNGLTIVDTDILIDAARQVSEATVCLDRLEHGASLGISVITEMELLVGCRNRLELQRLDRFLTRFRILRVNEAICDAAVDLLRRYRLSHGLRAPDAIIAATATAFEYPLITKNQADYRFISDLQLLPYP